MYLVLNICQNNRVGISRELFKAVLQGLCLLLQEPDSLVIRFIRGQEYGLGLLDDNLLVWVHPWMINNHPLSQCILCHQVVLHLLHLLLILILSLLPLLLPPQLLSHHLELLQYRYLLNLLSSQFHFQVSEKI